MLGVLETNINIKTYGTCKTQFLLVRHTYTYFNILFLLLHINMSCRSAVETLSDARVLVNQYYHNIGYRYSEVFVLY